MADQPRFDADDDLDDDDDQGPWPIRVAPPSGVEGWLAELVAGFARSGHPPAVATEDGEVVDAQSGDLLEAGVLLCLTTRGVVIRAEEVDGLIGVIGEAVAEMASMGPEWEHLGEVQPLAFTVYYLWTHIIIGHLAEDVAMAVVEAASRNLDRFVLDEPGA